MLCEQVERLTMNQGGAAIQNLSDIALWAAVYRARESGRPDGLFYDPFARRLAGERIALSLPFSDRSSWAWVMRTARTPRSK